MKNKLRWWETYLKTRSPDAWIILWAEDEEEIKKLRDLLIKDRIFVDSPESPPEIREKKKDLPSRDTRVLLFISDKVPTLQKKFLSHRPDLPVVLLLPEISDQLLSSLTHPSEESAGEPQPLHVVGIFKKGNLLDKNRFDLEDAGNLLRVIKQTLRSQVPEPHSQPEDPSSDFLVKPIHWKISIREETAEPLLTAFLDEPMRDFIHRLQRALHQMREGYRHLKCEKWQKVLPESSSGEEIKKWTERVEKWFEQIGSKDEKKPSRGKKPDPDLDACFRPSKIPRFQPAHILLEGETGTGKSFLRHLMVTFLNVPDPRVAYINATTLSKNLLEVQLFGSIKGAFTDAQTRPGVLFTHAFGLIFLDEIGDVDLEVQPKLLQYLEDFLFSPEGLTGTTFFSPTYFVAATNRDLKRLIAEGKFREDLYFRFRSRLRVPALRERKTDLKILISFLLQSPHINPGKQVSHISYRAIQALLEHDYRQGNFRELESILSEAVTSAISEKSEILFEKHILKALYKLTT